MHQRLVKPVLERLDRERATYFARVLDIVDRDPRLEGQGNLVYVVLRDTIPDLPHHLPEYDLVDRLFAFVEASRPRLRRTLYDPASMRDPARMRAVTGDFVDRVIAEVLRRVGDGEIATGERQVHRIPWSQLRHWDDD